MKNKKLSKFTKSIKNPDRDQFQFSPVFQLELLKYLVQNKEAILVLGKIKSSYFTLVEHSIICESLIRAHKKYKKVPGEVVLLEHTKDMLNTTEFVSLATSEDLDTIRKLVSTMYHDQLDDPDVIKSSLKQFMAYIELRDLTSKVDFTNFTMVQDYYQRVGKIIREADSKMQKEEPVHYMVQDVIMRQLQRKIDPEVIPTPFKQINELANAGGYSAGSVIVLLDKAKAKKTFTLINVARGYLTMRKNVLYIDTENGAAQIMGRTIQSTLQRTKSEIVSGDCDLVERRHMRKYKKLKVELAVHRIPAMLGDANDIRTIIRTIEAERGIKINILCVDYAGKMASIKKDEDDFTRISNVYIDLQNLAMDEKLDAVWTAHHITRDGSKHVGTKYEENDISGAISIVRNAVAIWGLNQTPEERDNNIQRMELVVQREGKPTGRALFHIDVERQRMREFTREQRKAYDESQGIIVDDLINSSGNVKTSKGFNNNATTKPVNTKGDI